MSEEKYITNPETARLNDDQLMLFPEFSKQFITSFQELHNEGLLSFDPTKHVHQTHSLQAEIAFFASLLENQLTIQQIKDLCTNLQKPYQYDPHKLMYSFTKKKWYAYEKRDVHSAEFVSEWIDQLQKEGNAIVLRNIIQLAAHSLFLLSGGEEDSEHKEDSSDDE